MPAKEKYRKQVEALAEKKARDPQAKREWDELLHAYDRLHTEHPSAGFTTPAQQKELFELLAEMVEKRHDEKEDHDDHDGGCSDEHPCDDQLPQVDMQSLAERIFQRLMFEARIERERIGRAA